VSLWSKPMLVAPAAISNPDGKILLHFGQYAGRLGISPLLRRTACQLLSGHKQPGTRMKAPTRPPGGKRARAAINRTDEGGASCRVQSYQMSSRISYTSLVSLTVRTERAARDFPAIAPAGNGRGFFQGGPNSGCSSRNFLRAITCRRRDMYARSP
jgi:hypothetical protein